DNQYIRVTRGDTGPGTVDPGYPAPTSNWGWPAGFGANGIDAALYSHTKCYFFKDNQYIRVTRGDTGPGTVDPGYPAPTSNWGWPGAFVADLVRRDAWDLESAQTFDPITLAYARAIQVMQARPVADPTSWAYQAAIHGTFAAPPAGAEWNGCQHRGWFFLPWHRMYLYYFERIVRKAVRDLGGPADFALPYWNYDKTFPSNTLPPAFRAPTLPDGTANPLFVPAPGRNGTLMTGGQVPATATTSAAAMSMTDFTAPQGVPSFGGSRVGPAHFGNGIGQLESTPHNVMHPTIGGGQVVNPCRGALMTDPNCAALDPIFWLHHANIDRLWNNWLELPGRANPVEAGWLNQAFVFHDETGTQVTLSCADVVDTAVQLNYAYDDEIRALQREVELAAAARPPERPPELVAASEHPLELVGSTASVRMTVPASARARTAAAGDEGAVLVSIDDVEADRDPGLAYAVYLDLPGSPENERHHIGNVSFFGLTEMNDPDRPHEGHAGFGQTFDATAAIQALRRQQRWDPASLSVTFEPIEVLPPPGEELSAAAQAERAAAIQPVRIGRVGLFVA
ncbi:tyrosinase family protein, partial [Kribbella sp. NPDC026611]|uniref:tyrosinase family protein n=1 Tax=Kribbella sp. NPDC026611 TaxID=3154911 RepID=UPI0033FA349B